MTPTRVSRRQRSRYFTGLVTDTHDFGGQPRTIAGAGWRATFRQTPATKTFHRGREVVLSAGSWVAAQQALNLIRASLSVLHGEPMLFGADDDLVAWNEREPEVKDRAVFDAGRGTMKIGAIPQSCLLAAKASRRRPWQYAVIKYRASVRLYGAFLADLDPSRRPRHLSLSPFADDHVMFALAILAAYSAVEDLGLELRASRDKPSRLNGEWNPEVRSDLENRLRAAGVSVSEPVLWTIRGSGTVVHKLQRVPVAASAPWPGGLMIRDGHVALVDAIAYADWLRDKIAAHGAKRLTPSLSPYDVVNVQHVARRLIMGALGFWKRWWEPTARHPKRSPRGRT